MSVVGSVLLFQHDVLHRGASVVSGTKYIMRTEIMYKRQAVTKAVDR